MVTYSIRKTKVLRNAGILKRYWGDLKHIYEAGEAEVRCLVLSVKPLGTQYPLDDPPAGLLAGITGRLTCRSRFERQGQEADSPHRRLVQFLFELNCIHRIIDRTAAPLFTTSCSLTRARAPCKESIVRMQTRIVSNTYASPPRNFPFPASPAQICTVMRSSSVNTYMEDHRC